MIRRAADVLLGLGYCLLAVAESWALVVVRGTIESVLLAGVSGPILFAFGLYGIAHGLRSRWNLIPVRRADQGPCVTCR